MRVRRESLRGQLDSSLDRDFNMRYPVSMKHPPRPIWQRGLLLDSISYLFVANFYGNV